jgi:hypothetical protein
MKAGGDTSLLRISLFALAGPSLWFIDLVARYFLVEAGAARQHPILVLSVGVSSALLASAASLACARIARSLSEREPTPRFLAALGAALGAFSALVIGAALIPHVFFLHGTEVP